MNAEERAESPRDASEAKAHHIAYATCIKFSFSTNALSAERSERTEKNGFRWSEKRRKDRQKKREGEAQNEVTLERNQKKHLKPNWS